MTEKERLSEVFTSFGIGFHENETSIWFSVSEECEKVEGYYLFETFFSFDETGKFVVVSIAE